MLLLSSLHASSDQEVCQVCSYPLVCCYTADLFAMRFSYKPALLSGFFVFHKFSSSSCNILVEACLSRSKNVFGNPPPTCRRWTTPIRFVGTQLISFCHLSDLCLSVDGRRAASGEIISNHFIKIVCSSIQFNLWKTMSRFGELLVKKSTTEMKSSPCWPVASYILPSKTSVLFLRKLSEPIICHTHKKNQKSSFSGRRVRSPN